MSNHKRQKINKFKGHWTFSSEKSASSQEQKSESGSDTNKFQNAKVTRVIDGDTIEIEGGKRVRYIGIDTPETKGATSMLECYAQEASSKNRELVEDKIVRLEKDVSETDRYGRFLRYVYVGDIFVNDYLVREGFASAVSYPPDVKYQDQFRQAEQEAREAGRGLWGACPKGQPKPSPVAPLVVFQDGNCDPSYPEVCIAPPPPDLDCADVAYRRFKVLPPDPHRFDHDKDGVGCESL